MTTLKVQRSIWHDFVVFDFISRYIILLAVINVCGFKHTLAYIPLTVSAESCIHRTTPAMKLTVWVTVEYCHWQTVKCSSAQHQVQVNTRSATSEPISPLANSNLQVTQEFLSFTTRLSKNRCIYYIDRKK